MGALSDFQLVVLLPFLTLGMVGITWPVYKWIQRVFNKREVEDENEKIAVCVIIGIACGFINLMWFIPQVVSRDAINWVVKAQYNNCMDTYTKDGDKLTEKQCQYFQDVLNGYYSEEEQRPDIKSYLGE